MDTYRVEFTKTYVAFIDAKSRTEALEIAEKMNDAQIQEAATYINDIEVTKISRK